jgi:hypothetical protein
MVINEGTKFRWTRTQLDSVLTHMFGKVKSIQQKMIEIKKFQNKVKILKVHSYLWVQIKF